jgi:hypothetical protein
VSALAKLKKRLTTVEIEPTTFGLLANVPPTELQEVKLVQVCDILQANRNALIPLGTVCCWKQSKQVKNFVPYFSLCSSVSIILICTFKFERSPKEYVKICLGKQFLGMLVTVARYGGYSVCYIL